MKWKASLMSRTHKYSIWAIVHSVDKHSSIINLRNLKVHSIKTVKSKNIHLQQVTTTDSSEMARYIYSYLLCSTTFRLHQCYTMTINRSNRRVVDSLLPLELLKYCQNAQIAKSSFLSIVSPNSKEGVQAQCLCTWEVPAVLLITP